MNVNKPALILPTRSPKFNKPTPKEPKMTVKFNQERKVLSLAKNTFGSTLAGKAILLLVDIEDEEVVDAVKIPGKLESVCRRRLHVG